MTGYRTVPYKPMQHKGEIIRKSVIDSGYSITKLAEKLGKSRRTLYNIFENPDVTMDLILEIGRIINHDFAKEIKDLKKYSQGVPIAIESEPVYGADFWKDKYYRLLETYNDLLKELVRKKK